MQLPGINEVSAAAERIKNYAHKTPVMTSRSINTITGCEIYFKCENFQRVGAFKFRGACNAVMSLSDEDAARGVITHSSGNHAQALALAASLRNIKATIVMPSNSTEIKIKGTQGYGAKVVFCEPTLESRETTTNELIEKEGATFIHPFNDPRIIAGQGTAALELINECGGFDYVVAPVGGGGLLSGTLISVSSLLLGAKVIAGEPEGADDAYRSLIEDRIVPSIKPNTIADGLLTSLGTLTFAIIKEHVHEIVRVSETEIIEAMRLIWERMKIIVEPSSAVALAALVKKKEELEDKRIGIILSGGNVDLAKLPF